MGKVYVGVDLHKTQFTVCIRWKTDGKHKEAQLQYPTTNEGYDDFFKKITHLRKSKGQVVAGVESTGNTRYFKNRLEEHGITVKIINTLQFKVICDSTSKTDWKDAATIARYLEAGMLPEVRLCSEQNEQLRIMLGMRTSTVRESVRLKNRIHSRLMAHGLEDTKASLQSKRGRQKVLNALHTAKNEPVLQSLFKRLEENERRVSECEADIREFIGENRTLELLRSIPGCGEITAWTILAFTDDIKRFSTPKKYAAYAGIVPWVKDSNTTVWHGAITHRGPPELRTALVQLVMGIIRMKDKTLSWRLAQRYQRMKASKCSGKAIIAMARKLSKIIWHMLTHDTPFSLRYMLDTSLKDKAASMRRMSYEKALATQAFVNNDEPEEYLENTIAVPVSNTVLPRKKQINGEKMARSCSTA